jgi:hypothetical protein
MSYPQLPAAEQQLGAFWPVVADLVAWIDESNGRSPHETAMRLMKLAEEAGEVMQAYIGVVGQNPRKGVTHTRADVADEVCDVIVTAAVALHEFTDDPAGTLAAKVHAIAARAGRIEFPPPPGWVPDRFDPENPPPWLDHRLADLADDDTGAVTS